MALAYTGPRVLGVAGLILLVGGLATDLLSVYAGSSVSLFGSALFMRQLMIEARWWRSKCEGMLDDRLERLLRAELPNLLGTRTTKRSSIVQDVVDELKE